MENTKTYDSPNLRTIIENKSGVWLDELQKSCRRVMKNVGDRAVIEARALVPVSENVRLKYRGRELTGDDAKHLRDTIGYKVVVDKAFKNPLSIRLILGATKFTAHFHELGTERMKKTPFIAPAMRKSAADFEHLLTTEAMKIKV